MTMAPGHNPLFGTWKLVSSTLRDVESGDEVPSFGSHPTGFLNYSPGGRVMVVIVGDRKEPSGPEPPQAEKVAWLDSALAYAGTYTLEGNQVTHYLEATVNPLRAAGKLVRSVRLEGRVLTLTGAPFHYTAERIGVVTLVWERIE